MLNGKTVMVTGATNGIGRVTAQKLAEMHAEVIVVGRNAAKCDTTVREIKAATGNNKVHFMVANLASLAQVRKLVDLFFESHDRLAVLVNNAGAFFNERKLSPEGYEMTLALNHLNYFLLTNLLLDTLKSTAEREGEARIVNVSSGAHFGASQGVRFDDIQLKRNYSGWAAYAQSKLMNVMFTYELAKRLDGTPVTANVLHPGFVKTGFGHNNQGIMMSLLKVVQQVMAIPTEQGAATSIYLAASPEVKGVSGQYFDKQQAVKSSPVSYDEESWRRLWEISAQMAGIEDAAAV